MTPGSDPTVPKGKRSKRAAAAAAAEAQALAEAEAMADAGVSADAEAPLAVAPIQVRQGALGRANGTKPRGCAQP